MLVSEGVDGAGDEEKREVYFSCLQDVENHKGQIEIDV